MEKCQNFYFSFLFLQSDGNLPPFLLLGCLNAKFTIPFSPFQSPRTTFRNVFPELLLEFEMMRIFHKQKEKEKWKIWISFKFQVSSKLLSDLERKLMLLSLEIFYFFPFHGHKTRFQHLQKEWTVVIVI